MKQPLRLCRTDDTSFVHCLAILMQAHFINALPESKGYFTWICRFALETHIDTFTGANGNILLGPYRYFDTTALKIDC